MAPALDEPGVGRLAWRLRGEAGEVGVGGVAWRLREAAGDAGIGEAAPASSEESVSYE